MFSSRVFAEAGVRTVVTSMTCEVSQSSTGVKIYAGTAGVGFHGGNNGGYNGDGDIASSINLNVKFKFRNN